MIVADRSEAAPLDLTDETVAGVRPEPATMSEATPAGDGEPTTTRTDVTIAAENRVLAKSLRRVLAVVDRQAADQTTVAELRQRLARAEETIEDLVAILVTSQSCYADR